MKKVFLVAMLSASVMVYSCKSKTDKAAGDSTATEQAATPTTDKAAPAETPGNAPKTYTATFSPDTAILGKQKEALVKVIPVSATDLSDPDGKSEGIEFTFKVSVTNKNKMGGNNVGLTPSEFRLALDNNTNISQTNGGYFSAQPEATAESENITYRIPAGAKPKALNLFYDETRVSVPVELK
ncbi:hypothetical protein D0C36_11330 [Mucilaginibacter conchicola]|uniref:DUF4352 domain-containing protein n=1 Tax=Mucilaginibacter conchicola TaxID=2303333 RepID=A0A372NSC5_9SPHI|nr:hypothetical protein [Mucilaginibacter conchicola]RFZ92032.1 hypothetical protein D0C36_11330 [Mucilaginibacter conchicola]